MTYFWALCYWLKPCKGFSKSATKIETSSLYIKNAEKNKLEFGLAFLSPIQSCDL